MNLGGRGLWREYMAVLRCERRFVLRSGRTCCFVLPPIRVVDPMLRGGGVGLMPHSGGWCEVNEVARGFKRDLRLRDGSARSHCGRESPPSLCSTFIRRRGVYVILVMLCRAFNFIVDSVVDVVVI